jgi:hypothetical protein
VVIVFGFPAVPLKRFFLAVERYDVKPTFAQHHCRAHKLPAAMIARRINRDVSVAKLAENHACPVEAIPILDNKLDLSETSWNIMTSRLMW